jgi:hypothetical protein
MHVASRLAPGYVPVIRTPMQVQDLFRLTLPTVIRSYEIPAT